MPAEARQQRFLVAYVRYIWYEMTIRTPLERWVNILGVVVLFGAGVLLAHELTQVRTITTALPATAAIPTNLLKYHETRRIPTGMTTVRALAFGRDGLYVAGDREIVVFAVKVRSVPLSGAPTCITETAAGDWLIGMGDHVERYSRTGRRLARWPRADKNSLLTGIMAEAGSVYVADAGARVVRQYDGDGHQRWQTPKSALVVPSPYLNIDASKYVGGVWVNDPGRHCLAQLTRDGKIARTIGQASANIDGFCGCCNPTDFVFMMNAQFVTAEKGIPRVKVYNEDGTLESVVAGPSDFIPGTVGLRLAVSNGNAIYILDPKMRMIRVYQRKTR